MDDTLLRKLGISKAREVEDNEIRIFEIVFS